ncbi:MAG TPA: TonB-dependent receptor [Patescibacteria group bacterium]|nr:TonB-dependent receptor [Patescibacteria group bacterium]
MTRGRSFRVIALLMAMMPGLSTGQSLAASPAAAAPSPAGSPAASTNSAATGSIRGTVVDADGTLPGVVVELSGPTLTKPKTAVTDAAGAFRFTPLPAGTYQIKATLGGGEPVTVSGILVKEGKENRLDPISLQIETVSVEGQGETVINQETNTVGKTITTEQVADLPTSRSYTEVLNLAAGVSQDDGSGGKSVYGSTGLESSYIIDGINTTSVESGLPSKDINFDSIEKIEVKTGGYEAEFGGAQGAVVNVVTKAGGNEFHGSLNYYLTPDSFAAEPETNGFGTQLPKPDNRELAGTVGGFLLKDKLYFFVSASHHNDGKIAPQRFAANFARDVAESTDTGDLFSLKLTWQVTPRNTIVGSAFSDPRRRALRDELEGIGGDRHIDTGGVDATITWTSALSDTYVLEGQVGSHTEGNETTPDTDFPVGADRRRSSQSVRGRGLLGFTYGIDPNSTVNLGSQSLGEPSVRQGPYAFSGKTDANRQFARFSTEVLLHMHDAKFGVELENSDFNQNLDYGWGTGVFLEWIGLPSTGFSTPQQVVGVRRCWGDGNGQCLDWDHQVEAQASSSSMRLFWQDRWTPFKTLNVNFGLRYESQEILDSSGRSLAKIDDNIAPRLGVTWDPVGNGKSKLYASAGRYYDSIPMQVVSRAFSPRVTMTRLYRTTGFQDFGQFYNDINSGKSRSRGGLCATNTNLDDFASFNRPTCWDFESTDLDSYPFNTDKIHGPAGITAGSSGTLTPEVIFDSGSIYAAPISSNLKGASTDEKLFGFQWEFTQGWQAGVKLIQRDLKNAIEDMSLDFGRNYVIGNPGRDFIIDFDPANQDLAALAPALGCTVGRTCRVTNRSLENAGFDGFPKATRAFRGYEFTLEKAVSKLFWFNLSYLNSETKGNYRGRYFSEIEERDPNLTEAFDVPALVVNSDGFLPQDRKHQVKLYGNFRVTPNFNVGSSYRYATGTPISATTDPAGGSTPFFGPIYLMPRGISGRTPNTQNWDLSLSYDVRDSGKMKMSMFLDLFNLLNEQKPVAVDEQFLAPGLWTTANVDPLTGDVFFEHAGRGEPYDGYIDTRFGNSDGTVQRSEWNSWAHSFEGKFDSNAQLYKFLKNEMVAVNVNGQTKVVNAYPGFQQCPANLPSNPADCRALNASYGAARLLEQPRSIRLGVKLSF